MPNEPAQVSANLRAARTRWPSRLSRETLCRLKTITREHQLSINSGELTLLDGNWYVTHSGLLKLARKNRCAGIHVAQLIKQSDPANSRWVFKATVFRSKACKGFTGYGDADPSNVSPLVRGAEMRVAETRAVNRALRKAYGIGICSVEEIGSFSGPLEPKPQLKKAPQPVVLTEANGNGHRLRDRLCLLIRQHSLDGSLVKLYAADFCGTKELKEASREQIEEFINHLAEYAQNNREGLLCQLNSYSQKQEEGAA